MNKDEVRSLIVKLLIMGLTALASALHQQLGADAISAIAADLADLAVLAYGIYDHWNMRKVPEVGNAPGGVSPASSKAGAKAAIAALALAGTAACLGYGDAHAADLVTKAKPVPFTNVYPTKACGFYYGLAAEGGAGIVNGAPAGTVQIGGDIGALVGYACPVASIPFFVQAKFEFQNLNAGNAGFALRGPAHFEQLAAVQTPLLQWMTQWINVGQNAIPNIVPLLPPGISITGTPQNYVGIAVTEDDISASFGVSSNREWLVSVGPRVGLLYNLTGPGNTPLVGDTFAEIQFQSNAMCLGVSGVCPKLGDRFLAGLELKM